MRYLIDTDWLVDVSIGRSAAAQVLDALRPQVIAVSIISHGELYEGAFDFADTEVRPERIRELLAQFETLLIIDPVIEIFGRTRSELRRTGRRIADLDLLIAATAVQHDLVLLTRNVRHFTRVPCLTIYQQD